ncbi:MAG: HD-GYP domain-containing protein [Burkholderiales bacterium]
MMKERRLLVERLCMALEYRERGVSNRPHRMMRYAWLMARAAGAKSGDCELLSLAAPMHDIGMVGVPSSILSKSGPLAAHEWDEVRRHPGLGAELIGVHEDPLLKVARVMALTHHERWDGEGYPAKLAGEAIPMAGRLMAVIDAFEAMTVTQRHSPPVPGPEAARRIVAESGRQFDPAMVEVFRTALPKMAGIVRAFPDRMEGLHDLDFSASGAARRADKKR